MACRLESLKKSLPLSHPKPRLSFARLLADNAELKARIEELERRAKGKTPQNSSLPPSTQHPHARPQPPRRKSKKKRGGQPGHKKHERPLIPIDQSDDVQTLRPNECRRCGAKLAGNDPEPLLSKLILLTSQPPHCSLGRERLRFTA